MPDWKTEIQHRLSPLHLSPAREADVAEELAQHLDDHYTEMIAGGATPELARRSALACLDAHELLGALRLVTHDAQLNSTVRGDAHGNFFASLLQDVRYGIRMLRRAPVFSTVGILALAIGIGANTAVFSLISTVLLRPFYPDIDRLVVLEDAPANAHTLAPGEVQRTYRMSYPKFVAWSQQKNIFESVAAAYFQGPSSTGVGEPQRLMATYVTSNFLPMLGIAPALGRGFRSDEEPLSAPAVVILSDGLWRSRFNAAPSVIGGTLTLNDQAFTVIGVLPASAHFLGDPDVIVPLRPGTDVISPTFSNMTVFARLRPGLSLAAATAAIASQASKVNGQFGQNTEVLVIPLEKYIAGNSRPLLMILLGAVAVVLLIACANTANLLLARGASRQREIAIRVALGAGRGRLIWQLLTESLLMSLGGAICAVALLWAADQWLTRLLANRLPAGVAVHLDTMVLGFTLGLAALTGILCGLAPALQSSVPDLRQPLNVSGRISGAPASQRVRSALVVAEIALSLALLAGTGLLLRSFSRVLNEDKGFDPEHVLTLRMWPSPSRYADPRKDVAYLDAIVQSTSALPGVQAAGWVSNLPLFGNAISGDITIEGVSDNKMMMASKQLVAGDYFRAMHMPLIRGRFFNERDTLDYPLVAIVDQTFVQRYLDGQDPIGKHVNFGYGGNGWCEIVGVVGAVKEMSLDSAASPTMYVPLAQRASLLVHMAFSLAVRTSGDPAAISESVRDAIHQLDSTQILEKVRTMDEWIDTSVAPRRTPMILFGSFAVIALFLAAIGVYGVLSHWVTQRQEEIGMRVALGAQRSDVFRLVLRHALKMIAIGISAGIAISIATTRILSGLLYHIKPTDAATFTAVSLLLGTVALLACAIPVLRATRVDPLMVLRNE